MSSQENISFSLQLTVDEAVTELRRIQTLTFQTLSLLRKMGLPEDVNSAIVHIQRLISIMNQARLAAIALNMASGPVGWALAGVGLAATGVMVYEMAENEVRG